MIKKVSLLMPFSWNTWNNEQINNNICIITHSRIYFLAESTMYFSGLWDIYFILLQHKCFYYNPSWRCPDKEKWCQNEMLICPHILPMLLLYNCQWKIRGFGSALAEEQRKTEAKKTESLKFNLKSNVSLCFRWMICCWSALIIRVCGIFCGPVWHL